MTAKGEFISPLTVEENLQDETFWMKTRLGHKTQVRNHNVSKEHRQPILLRILSLAEALHALELMVGQLSLRCCFLPAQQLQIRTCDSTS